MNEKKSPATLGRPRSFDVDEALDKALEVFWRKGYEGTSLLDLTEAMGINRPSLYAAFGNKESLFRKALDRYGEGPAAHVSDSFTQPTARATIERFLYGSMEHLTRPGNPIGCLGVQGALSTSDEAQPVRQEMIARRVATEAGLRERLERAKAEGDLPESAQPAEMARYFCVVANGMAVQGVSGASREELESVVEMALLAWPS